MQNEEVKEEGIYNLFQHIIRDSIPVSITPWATQGIVAICIAIFFLQFSWPDLYNLIFLFGALNPASWTYIYTIYQLLTYMWLHADINHLIINMAFLWCFGDNVEEAIDHKEFLVLYLVSGIIAGAAHSLYMLLFYPLYADIACVGSSGAIAGVMAAYLLTVSPNEVILFDKYKVNSHYLIAIWFLTQIYYMIVEGFSYVSYIGHIAGFLAGLGVTFYYAKVKRS